MTFLKFCKDPGHQGMHKGYDILPDVLVVVLHEILQEAEV